jgi:hypothetical protein
VRLGPAVKTAGPRPRLVAHKALSVAFERELTVLAAGPVPYPTLLPLPTHGNNFPFPWHQSRARSGAYRAGGAHRCSVAEGAARAPVSAGVEIDCGFLLRGTLGEPLKDPDYFRQVRVDPELRTIVWPNGLDPAPELLHGDFEPAATVSQRSAA